MTDQPLITEEVARSSGATEASPAEYAWSLFTRYCETAPMEERRELGQYFTPPQVAAFMANLAVPEGRSRVRILEPGAGTGILTAALCERLPGSVERVEIETYEVHPTLANLCEETLRHTARWLEGRGVACEVTVHRRDFVIENASFLVPSLFNEARETFDVAIANPPYFKLQKDDRRARAAAHIVHGQPNIYAIFMAIMASLLMVDGVMVTITPRSFTTGDYFRRFREVLFSSVVPESLHLFGSRKDAFRKDEVLQENVIMRARRGEPRPRHRVTITSSAGVSDLDAPSKRTVPLRDVVDLDSRDQSVHIPVSRTDDRVLSFVRDWSETLHSLGLQVSTGPVVAFRARHFLHEASNGENEVPLLWLQHVRRMEIRWPIDQVNKNQYVSDCEDSQSILLPNRTYVVMRRFSAKEEHRRIVAAPLVEGDLPGETVGLENHLNYIHRPKGRVGTDEARGLAAILNSALVDRYFRISNGNTQVSASELRQLPLPSLETIEEVGCLVAGCEVEELDHAVADALNVPAKLMRELERTVHGET